jgi:hypothetical protein
VRWLSSDPLRVEEQRSLKITLLLPLNYQMEKLSHRSIPCSPKPKQIKDAKCQNRFEFFSTATARSLLWRERTIINRVKTAEYYLASHKYFSI